MQDIHDVVCLVLLIKINHAHRHIMSRRRLPCLDDYLDRVQMALWPRLKQLLDTQLSSIRAGSEKQLFTGEVAVHGLTSRYATLTATMYTLISDNDTPDQGAFRVSYGVVGL